ALIVRWAVIVNGPPGSGKSTLAGPLAERLGVPLLAKDAVKETLLDELGYADRAASRAIGAASGEVLWTVLAGCPRGAVVESWLAPSIRDIVRSGLDRAAIDLVVEVWCDCPPDEASRRYAERERHPGHFDAALLPDLPDVLRTAAPLALGAVLRVPTHRPVDVEALTVRVVDLLSDDR
ncbi:MAG TPA: AAA family ATPase, partial [Candidatus Nanopelagicales bacterium]|nr:AAA family ATPase [Candidatus Nanopelagicales bacterium]